MIESVNVKTLLKGLFFSLLFILVFFFISYFDNRTKIVFCDVGQGDGAYIRIKNRFDIVIDAGPDRKILNCIGRYMPFYDRTIELAFISHDQKDHFGGFDYLLDRYRIKKVFMPDLETSLQSFKRLKQKMIVKKTRIQVISAGMNLQIMNDIFFIHWPIGHCIAADNNDCSLIFTFKENTFKALFTGDASPKVLNSLSRKSINTVTVLKVPHHGSKNGLTEKFLRLANPTTTVISVGKKNSYGHPSKEILDMLQSHKIKIRRTDKEGDIVFKITNSKYQIPNNIK